jgi:ABC-2 type transport system permease protein
MAALEVHPRVWYNPDVKSVNFVVPGLIATIVFILTVFMTGPTVVQEREQGTIEQLMVTPIPPLEMVVGKVAPYIVVAFLEIIEALALGAFRFGMPIKGSIFLLLALSCVFLMTLLGIGVFASSVAKTYREAVLMVPFIMLPSIFFSGFLFPLEAMPGVLQGLSYLIPRRHTLTIIRGIILKGVGLTTLKWEVMALVAFGMLILAFAATRFHKRIE